MNTFEDVYPTSDLEYTPNSLEKKKMNFSLPSSQK